DQAAEQRLAAGVPVPKEVKKKPEPRDASAADQLRAKLAQPITLERGIEKNTPLRDALEFLADRFEVKNIIFDNKALEAINVQNAEEAQVTLPKMTGVPISTVLRLLVGQVRTDDHEVTYLVRGNYIEITSDLKTKPELWVGANRRHAIPVDAEYENRPLEQALRELADSTGINVILDARVVEKTGKTPVTATLNSIPLDTAVRLLADMADLKAVAIDNALYVTTKPNAEALQAEQEKRKAMAREPEKKEKATPVEAPPKKAGEPAPKDPPKK
ncbi:MAG TPA: hypothetical protein VKI65_03965, partial [Gemmataceae bacterium]|nr:hypothetical protein [Gemmataceae bacterium]